MATYLLFEGGHCDDYGDAPGYAQGGANDLTAVTLFLPSLRRNGG